MTEFQKTFPQAEKISNSEICLKVERCWEEALSRGGWTYSDLEAMPFSLMAVNSGVSLATHTRTVTDCCIALAEVLDRSYPEKLSINFDYLIAGAILHDVGKPLEYQRNSSGKFETSRSGKMLRHPISGTALAALANLPEEVQHIIAVHSREGDGGYRSPEAWIIHHADFVNFEPLR